MHSAQDSQGGPPSYDEIFGRTPGSSSSVSSRLSPRNPSSPSVSPQISSPSVLLSAFQNDSYMNNVAEETVWLTRQDHTRRHSGHIPSSTRGHAVVNDHVRTGSLRQTRLDPTAPLRDEMEGLRIAGVEATPPPYSPSPRSDHRSVPSSSQAARTEFTESSASIPNWQKREEELEMQSWFAAVDEDNDGYITTTELQQSLLNDNWTTFSMDTIQMILKMFDKNFNNLVDFDEFIEVKKYINQWKTIFDRYDEDRSGTIDVAEIREAFHGMGHTISQDFCKKLCRRFCQKTPGKMDLDAFIYVCATVSKLDKDFRRRSSRSRNETFEEVLMKWIH